MIVAVAVRSHRGKHWQSAAHTGGVPGYPQGRHAAEAAQRVAGWRGHAVMAVVGQIEISG